MLDRLLDYPIALAATIIAASAVNYAMWSVSFRELPRQSHVDTSTTSAMRPGSQRAALVQHLGLPTAIALLALSGGPFTQLSAGYLILQFATVVLNIDAWLRWRLLRIPGIVEGRLIPTPEYQYRTSAARIVPFAIFSGMVAALFGSVAFAIGSLLLFATAVGWHLRARSSPSVRSGN